MFSHPKLPQRQRKAVIAALIVLSILLWHNLAGIDSLNGIPSPVSIYNYYGYGKKVGDQLNGHREFWATFGPLLDLYKPTCAPPTRLGVARNVFFGDEVDTYTRTEEIEIDEESLEKLENAHLGFVQELTVGLNASLSYAPGSRGIVSTAGGKYLPTLVATIRLLRRTGSKLPVEVFMTTDEYDPLICDEVLPQLEARCVDLNTIFSASPSSHKISHYQYKVFSLLFSSFEHTLFLDADIFPVRDPTYLFESEPYLSHHLIGWPDFWYSTISRLYYTSILHTEVPPLSTRASTESGAIVVSRSNPGTQKALMLAAYYNYYGPDYYYPIFSQGASGEGDKETFITAADALNVPFYTVRAKIGVIGRFKQEENTDADGETTMESVYHGYGMIQHDPVHEYAHLKTENTTIAKSKKKFEPKPLFIHAHHPKPNAALIFEETDDKGYLDSNGSDIRMWGDKEQNVERFGFDVEYALWESVKWVSCWTDVDDEDAEEMDEEKRDDNEEEDACERVTRYMKNVFGE